MNIENMVENVRKLTNFEIAYGLALQLNHKYDFGGYSVGRSERSYLLDFFLRLNCEKQSSVSDLNPFVNKKIFLAEGEHRLKEQVLNKENKNSEFQDNKEHFSVVVLYLWITHYRIKIMELRVLDGYKGDMSLNEIDFSFQSEIQSAELIYNLCLIEVDVNEGDICTEALKYLCPKSNEDDRPVQTYKIELSWHVNDLCAADED